MYKTAIPHDHINKYVNLFWQFEKEHYIVKPFAYHAIAGSKVELIFFYDGDFTCKDVNGNSENVVKSGFYGQSTDYGFYSPTSEQSGVFGVQLNPTAFMTLFNIPASEITNRKLDITNILGNKGNEIIDKIASAKSFSGRINVIVTLIDGRLKTLHQKYLPIQDLLHKMETDKTPLSIPEMVAQSYLSQRQFERNFKELTGFSAKTYLKITRFEQLIDTVNTTSNFSELKLLDTALDLGYYDQAHLNHHFKEFTGLNPSSFFKERLAQFS
jgi:AraC-like DNA-binding protein